MDPGDAVAAVVASRAHVLSGRVNVDRVMLDGGRWNGAEGDVRGADGRADGRTDGRTNGRTNGRADGRTALEERVKVAVEVGTGRSGAECLGIG